MAAQSAAIFALHKCEKRRKEDAERQRETREFVKRVLQKYDHSSTGGLLFDELRSYLLDLHPERKGKGAKVKNAEVKWVIQMATPQRVEINGDWENGTYQLAGEELQTAAEVWLQYLNSYDEVSDVFDKHCTDADGLIDQATVKLVMKELLGEEPSDEDVTFVVAECSMGEAHSDEDVAVVVARSAGKLSKPGFVKAISLFERDRTCHHISREKLRTYYEDHLVENNRILPKIDTFRDKGKTISSESIQGVLHPEAELRPAPSTGKSSCCVLN